MVKTGFIIAICTKKHMINRIFIYHVIYLLNRFVICKVSHLLISPLL